MSFNSVGSATANSALQWLESTNKTSSSDSSATKPNGAADLSEQAFIKVLMDDFQDFSGAANAAAGSAAEQLLGTRGVTPAGSNAPAADGSTAAAGLEGSLIASASTNPSASAPQTSPDVTTIPGLQPTSTPAPTPTPGTINDVNPQQLCNLADAQSVLAAFPGATLEVMTETGPVAASSLTGTSADQQLPYVVAYGATPDTPPNLYYAGVILNEGQQALQQTGQGVMTAGDYYIVNSAPDADGSYGVTDVGSSFAQFAQYFANQLMAGNSVTPTVYTPYA